MAPGNRVGSKGRRNSVSSAKRSSATKAPTTPAPPTTVSAPPHSLQGMFVGMDTQNPVFVAHPSKGAVLAPETYVSLDSTASTPPLKFVRNKVDEFMRLYSSVHRGTGFKSVACTHFYAQSRDIIKEWAGIAESEKHLYQVIYGKNTTEVLNILVHQFNRFTDKRCKVVTTNMEHHSNDLPWRYRVKDPEKNILRIPFVNDEASPNFGRLDMDAYRAIMQKHGSQVAVVAVTGASNTTGWINDAKTLADVAHKHGAMMHLDCAQLAPHRPMEVTKNGLDMVTFCGHKMYAPYGTAALVVRSGLIYQDSKYTPLLPGGGTVLAVGEKHNDVFYDHEPHASEGGSPNTAGGIALAAAIKAYNQIGWDAIIKHEKDLTKLALEGIESLNGGEDLNLKTVEGKAKFVKRKRIRVFGATTENLDSRLGVVCFDIEGVYHSKVGAILGHEYGIGIRTGCFCAHPYVVALLKVPEDKHKSWMDELLSGNNPQRPGLCRASFGLYNTAADVQKFLRGLRAIIDGQELIEYAQDPKDTSVYIPSKIRKTGASATEPWNPNVFEAAFTLEGDATKV